MTAHVLPRKMAITSAVPSHHQPAQARPQLIGGVFDKQIALNLMNAWFFVSERDGEASVYRIEDDGTLTHLAIQDFQLLLANIFVDIGKKQETIWRYWLHHPKRRTCKRIVFEPSGNVAVDEYNLWRGFAIEPKAGYSKQRRLLHHIRRVICKRDKQKFRYLMRWLAWAVQNPHRHAEAVVVLMSNTEGSGKSTLGSVMLDIFGLGKGRHGLLVDDKDQLLGKFNSHLETTCFVLGEEVLWAGDPRIADAFKSRITASTIPIEEKYRQRRQVPNRLHVILTTNHTWAISAGVQARRYFVVEVSDEVAQDEAWFGPLYHDLEKGGTREFLHLLLNLKLRDWHPREMPKTEELALQQVLSAGSVEQWLLACADTDAVIGGIGGGELDTLVSTHQLYQAYCDFVKQRGGSRAESLPVFGRVLTKICGPSRRLAKNQSGKRSPGYWIPKAAELSAKVHQYLKTGC